MTLFDITAILLTASAMGSYINHKWLELPSSIGLMLWAMVLGFLGLTLKEFNFFDIHYVEQFLSHINFNEIVFHGMLAFLLFSGALQINIDDLKTTKIPIALTATVSTFISTLLIGLAFYFLANQLGFTSITLLYAMLFGAILSPTDPIAVLSIIKKMKASKFIETTITGESLFNDGIAIVFFLCILDLITVGQSSLSSALGLFFQEVVGGCLIGVLLGLLASKILSTIDDYQVELLITLAVATGGYALAEKLHLSAPLAMVVAGLIIGNQGQYHRHDITTKRYVTLFWEVMDEILNIVLFFLIGLEMMVINANFLLITLGILCAGLALIARFISLSIPLKLFQPFYAFKRGTIVVMTWGGLRGALSIAMVLSLPMENIKDILLPCIYIVVVLSITVQSFMVSKMLKKYKMGSAG